MLLLLHLFISYFAIKQKSINILYSLFNENFAPNIILLQFVTSNLHFASLLS